MTPATETPARPSGTEALADRVFGEGMGAFHVLCVYLGIRLGLYRALADGRPHTAVELANAAGLDPRYVREWLQAEAIAGLVTASGDIDTGQFLLAAGVRDALVDETHPGYIGGLPTAVAAVGGILPSLIRAFQTGEGVPYAAYGPEAVEAAAALNRPAFVNALVAEWLPAVPDVLARLKDVSRPALVADLGCGVGWSSIELAKAFPHVRVDGFDADEESIARARRHAVEHHVADRVTFEVRDVSARDGVGAGYDLVLFLECLHDLGRPVEALENARRALAPGGAVLVMDERVAETMPPPGDAIETFFATASVLWCLPQSRVAPDCEAPGAVMRPDMLRNLARRAGWSDIQVLAIEHPFWRFYRLV